MISVLAFFSNTTNERVPSITAPMYLVPSPIDFEASSFIIVYPTSTGGHFLIDRRV